jgi:hypothetical protein
MSGVKGSSSVPPSASLDNRDRWKAALKECGEATIASMLKKAGPGPTDSLPLHLGDGPDPPRAYVEDWLKRKANRRAAHAPRKFMIRVWLIVFAFVGAALVAFEVVMRWLKVGS